MRAAASVAILIASLCPVQRASAGPPSVAAVSTWLQQHIPRKLDYAIRVTTHEVSHHELTQEVSVADCQLTVTRRTKVKKSEGKSFDLEKKFSLRLSQILDHEIHTYLGNTAAACVTPCQFPILDVGQHANKLQLFFAPGQTQELVNRVRRALLYLSQMCWQEGDEPF